MCLSTVRHEYRHCYQNDLCDKLPDNKSEIFYRTIEIWDNNRKKGNYIQSGTGYENQALEDDANSWASRTG